MRMETEIFGTDTWADEVSIFVDAGSEPDSVGGLDRVVYRGGRSLVP